MTRGGSARLPLAGRFLAAFFLSLGWADSAGAQSAGASIGIHRSAGPITVDGDLSDPGWRGASRIESFVEISPGDNVPPNVKTTLLLTYDDRFFYAAFDCEDPDPSRIRAAYSDRDQVGTDQDYAGIFLDTRHDRRTVVEFFANARGAQYDAVQDDATGNEDGSADFFWDSAGRIDAHGWTLEIRIPFSSLRYPRLDPQTWGIIAYRNYTREDRHALSTSAIPRGSSCFVCHERNLEGLEGLPLGAHYVLAPYATAKEEGSRSAASSSGRFINGPNRGNAGLDAKWIPNADTAFDATVNPDFSQVEADVPQISVNSRFALFYPEKRPFFLEGLELFATPIPAVYTRTITSPRWGVRATGKIGDTAYTALLAEDRGGGSVVLPSPESSTLVAQDFESLVSIARLRHDVGRSFASFLFTDRENRGGGYNRVFGPDFQWNPNETDQVSGQLLLALTKSPERRDLSPNWRGQSFSSLAGQASWNHAARRIAWFLEYQDFGEGFRADDGYVPQVGYRRALLRVSDHFYPEGFFSRVVPLFVEDYSADRSGRTLLARTYPGVQFRAKSNATGEIDYVFQKIRAGGRIFDRRQIAYNFSLNPGSALPNLSADGFLGGDVDFVNARAGNGGLVNLSATVRATDHIEFVASASRQWLDVRVNAERESRLFTADIGRLKATYNFNARTFLRAITEYVSTERDPAAYGISVPRKEAFLTGSALFAYKLNWQTVLFLGYGDDRAVDQHNDLVRRGRQFFFKASYAFQR